MMAMRTLERVRNQRENSLVPRSHGAGANQDGLVDGEDADECPYRGDQYSVIYAIAGLRNDGMARKAATAPTQRLEPARS